MYLKSVFRHFRKFSCVNSAYSAFKGTLSYFLTPFFISPIERGDSHESNKKNIKKSIKKYCDLAELWLLKVWVFSSSRPNLKLKSVTSPRQKLSRVTSSEHFDESSIAMSRISFEISEQTKTWKITIRRLLRRPWNLRHYGPTSSC